MRAGELRNLFFAKILPPSPPSPFPSLHFAKRPSAALEKKELKPLQEVPQRRWEAEKRREGEAKAAPVSRSGIFKKASPSSRLLCGPLSGRERKEERKKKKGRFSFPGKRLWKVGKREKGGKTFNFGRRRLLLIGGV